MIQFENPFSTVIKLPKAIVRLNREDHLWQSTLRSLLGTPAQSMNEAVLHDNVDLIPIIGDIPSWRRVFTNKGNRWNQFGDAIIGTIPIIGDIADFVFASNTNQEQWEMRSKTKEMGTLETVVTFKFIDNTIDKYIGRSERASIWNDDGVEY